MSSVPSLQLSLLYLLRSSLDLRAQDEVSTIDHDWKTIDYGYSEFKIEDGRGLRRDLNSVHYNDENHIRIVQNTKIGDRCSFLQITLSNCTKSLSTVDSQYVTDKC